MNLAIDMDQLGRLFPAFMVVDERLALLSIGPSIRRNYSDASAGDPLDAHFSAIGDSLSSAVDAATAAGSLLQLRSRSDGSLLSGAVVRSGEAWLLAMHHVVAPTSEEGSRLQISDFAPGDPAIFARLLVSLQQAMLEEAHANALDLVRERQRSQNLLDRVSRVAGYMAHDFNNILSILLLNGERVLKSSSLTEQQHRLVRNSLEIVARGSDVTRSLMTLAHQKNDASEPLCADALLSEHLAFFSTIVGTSVALEARLNAGDALVNASRSGFVNGMMNLLINARDAMPDGGSIIIASRLDPDDVGAQRVVIEVTDSGMGMEREVLARAFEPLFSTKATGNGIGLASVADFARECGGEVRIDSAPGAGTSASIMLPTIAPDERTESAPAPLATGDDDASQRRILVVEDEPYALEALCELLADEGHEVSGAGSAAEALAILAGQSHGVLLSDVLMQDMDGLALAREATALVPGLRVVLMSGYVPNAEQMRGEWAFIRKPLDTQLLLKILRKAASVAGPAATCG